MLLKKRHIKVYVGETGQQTIFESEMKSKSSRIDFEVKKYCNGGAYGMNTASIELYNISEDSFKLIHRKEIPVYIEAGWEGEENVLFNGMCYNSLRTKKNATEPDVITTLLCSSGLKMIQQGVYTKDFSKEAESSPLLEIKTFIRNIFTYTTITQGNSTKILDMETIFVNKLDGSQISGYVIPQAFDASPYNILKDLCDLFNFNFQIEETKVIIRPREQDPTVYTITPDDGLIGIPEITEKGVDFKTFLNPKLEAGIAFTLSSKYTGFKLGALEYLNRNDITNISFNKRDINEHGRYEGSYCILSLVHKGSSHTNEWQSEIEAQNYIVNPDSARNR
jgi:hypothetical protein